MAHKKNCGLLLYNNTNGILRYPLVKKKYTYQFIYFVLGWYSVKRDTGITIDLTKISYFERMLMMCVPLEDIIATYCAKHYINAYARKRRLKKLKYKFDKYKHWINDTHGQTFEVYISALELNPDIKWEIPKGKLEPNETPISCAKREFTEETGLDNFTVFKKLSSRYEIEYYRKTKYTTTYYFGMMDTICYGKIDKNEIGAFGWFTTDEIANLKMDNRKRNIVMNYDIYVRRAFLV